MVAQSGGDAGVACQRRMLMARAGNDARAGTSGEHAGPLMGHGPIH